MSPTEPTAEPSDREPGALEDSPVSAGNVSEEQTLAYEPLAEEDWESQEQLPRRPRRRVLAPVPVTLMAVLLLACGFLAGVLVEKGQSNSNSVASGGSALVSRFAGLRGAAGAGAGAASGAGGLFARSGAGGAGGAGAAATVGEVANVDGGTLYVTTAEGNTVKVTTAPGLSVTKTVNANVSAIHPGETVIVTGPSGANGSISASSIRLGGSTSAGGASGGPALFGSGG
jgi:hypothetical protein